MRKLATLIAAATLLTVGAGVAEGQVITVVNQANVRPWALAKVERAVVAQALQLQAAWGTPTVSFGPDGWKLYLKTGHGFAPSGIHANPIASQGDAPLIVLAPYAIAWTAGDTLQAWSSVLSHETMEMLVDPYQQTYSTGAQITGSSYSPEWTEVEVADPVSLRTYRLDGVNVADFTLPSYWTGGRAPYDEMGAVTVARAA